MPLADYRCNDCGYIDESVFSLKAPPKNKPCPKCNGIMERLYTGRLGFNENKLKMDREHEVWAESKAQRLSSKEL